MLNYYRSKSQNMPKPGESEVHPKSQVSSPMEASASTRRHKGSIPATIHADKVIRKMGHQRTDSKGKKQSPVRKQACINGNLYLLINVAQQRSTRKYSKLNLRSGKANNPSQNSSKRLDNHETSSTWMMSANKENAANMMSRSKLVHLKHAESNSNF